MCSTPSMPKVETNNQEDIAAPTYADAKVTKAGADTKERTRALSARNIKTSSRGLGSESETEKSKLLGV